MGTIPIDYGVRLKFNSFAKIKYMIKRNVNIYLSSSYT